MRVEEYNALSWEQRYHVLHDVFDAALDCYEDDPDAWLPTPAQVAHMEFVGLPRGYQVAVRGSPPYSPLEERVSMKTMLNKKDGWFLPWWFTWPVSRCVICRRWFLRHWLWSCFEECCSQACSEQALTALDDLDA